MKVFVTGVSGFVGSHVTKALIARGHNVLGLVTPSTSLWRIKDELAQIKLIRSTLQDLPQLKDLLQSWRPDACIHLAWFSEPGKYLNSLKNLASLQGSLELIQALSNCGCRQFVGAGTCAEYDLSKKKMLREIDKTGPQTIYAASKLSFQIIGERIALQNNMIFSWGRIFYLYGMMEDTRRIIPSAILSLQKGKVFPASTGEQVRDYLNVQDVSNAFIILLEKEATGTYNICSANPVSVRHILDTISSLTRQSDLIDYGSLPYREWEPMYICGNNKKISKLGWKPTINLEEGLREFSIWLQKEHTKH